MNKMNSEIQREVQVISFLSGKGGVGKTTAALSISYLLNSAGFRVLLIDFDFATFGASYFYKFHPCNERVVGIYEVLAKRGHKLNDTPFEANRISYIVKEGIRFIPSRANFSKKLALRDDLPLKEENLKSFLLSIFKLYEKEDYDFIIIDNQAGSNLTARVSASVSNKVIIVSEPDQICSDAAETLLIQIGEVFPEYRRHLINKLEFSARSDYEELYKYFQSLNRLPPLPFDFGVRSAFSSRQIPIDVDKPTTFLIALYNSVKSFLPEFSDRIDKYGEKILDKFNQIQDIVDSYLNRKKGLEDEINVIRRRKERRELKTAMGVALTGLALGTIVATAGFLGIESLTSIIIPSAGAAIIGVSFLYLFLTQLQYKEKTEDIARKEEIDSELAQIDREIDRYKSLMLTRTKEYLLIFQKPAEDKGNHSESAS